MTICPLGRGGQAEVEKVIVSGQERARKRLLPATCTESGRERFQREIDILKLLEDSPYTIDCIEDGQYKFDGAEVSIPYYVMPLAEMDFEKYLESRTWNNDKSEILARLYELALAICHAHGLSIIHRDIKPKNILIMNHSIRLSDFGLGKNTGQVNNLETRAGASAGSNYFRAPELSGGFGECDESADVYSFGVVFLSAVLGRVPKTRGRKLYQEIDASELIFGPFLKKCVALDPLDRFPNGTELLQEFSKYLRVAIEHGEPLSLVLHPGEALPGIAAAIKNGASLLANDFISIINISDQGELRKLPGYVDNSMVSELINTDRCETFLETVDKFNDEIFERNTSFAFVDIVGNFYHSLCVALIEKVVDMDDRVECGEFLARVKSMSLALLRESVMLNRYEGGRMFIRIFSKGGDVREEILRDIVSSLDDRHLGWIKNDLDYRWIEVSKEIEEILP